MTAYWCIAPGPLTLADTLGAAGRPAGAIAFLSSATAHQVTRWDGKVLRTARGPCELTGVFSARLFDGETDLRWLHDGGGRGRAVAVTENPGAHSGWAAEEIPVTSTVDGEYALWGGRFEAIMPGWCRALEGRLNGVELPADPPETEAGQDFPSRYLCLRYREYLTIDEFGNTGVAEERLLGLAETTPTYGETR
ncbi:type III-D CRISPR-associated protein Csx19 [Gandjariella thermophila]|uniref:CRISPR-associated protein n=1 Tax=Gandjariella thermophila TaxID=1931992 RepID=A0A4D4J579_9PSEU|nr:CRISPR-associated protein Csx19 [Gandjariella thermophila]GDY31835.1 hypothetical protein GTS_34680 [Gandjariella thermophila]